MFRSSIALILGLAINSVAVSQSDSPKVPPAPVSSAVALSKRCQAKLDQDSPEASGRCFRAALVHYPASSVLHEGLAESLEKLGRLDDAESEYRAADGKTNYSLIYSFAKRMYERGEIDRAIRLYQSLFPKSFMDGAIAKDLVGLLSRGAKWRELGKVCEGHYRYSVSDSVSMACSQPPGLELEVGLASFRANPSSYFDEREKLTIQLVKAGRLKDAAEVCQDGILVGCTKEIYYFFGTGRKQAAIQLADEVIERSRAKGEPAPYLQASSMADPIVSVTAADMLSMELSEPERWTNPHRTAVAEITLDDRLTLCLEPVKYGDTIHFVLYNFLQKMKAKGQLVEAVDAMRRVAPDFSLDLTSVGLNIGNDDFEKLLYQGYFLLKTKDSAPLADGSCNFQTGPGLPAGTRVRVAYSKAVSCKNDPIGGQLALVEYQDRVWSAHTSGFNFVVAAPDAPIRPFENKTYDQAIAQLTGGAGAPVDEVTLGLMARKDILGKQKIYADEAAQKVGSHAFQMLMSTPIARSGNVSAFDLTLLDDSTVNAFSTAGGHIYVDKGMLPIIGDDEGLWSAVIAHEVAHVVSHHQYKTYMRVATLKATQEALRQQAALGNKSAQWAYLFSLGGGHLLNMKLSRNEELEADRLGLLMMAQAGIHPDYAEVLMRRLHAITGDKSKMAAFLLSDHPRWETREKKVRKAREEALSIFNREFASASDSPGGIPPVR
jgi:tetratricopeptide (TPR) repeat protein